MTEPNKVDKERHRKIDLPANAHGEFWLQRLGDKIQLHTAHAAAGGSGNGSSGKWDACSQYGCCGEALSSRACFAHSDATARRGHLIDVANSKKTLSLKGITISQSLWDEIVSSSIFNDGIPIVPIDFTAADISAAIRIENRELVHLLNFTGVRVFAAIEFRSCKFMQGLIARFGLFSDGALNCTGSTFAQLVDISYAQADRTSFGFDNCTFEKQFIADGIAGTLILNKSKLRESIYLRHSKASLHLDQAHLLGAIDISYADCPGFRGELLVAETANRLGPCRIGGLNLQRATFQSRLLIDVTSDNINLAGLALKRGGLLDVQANSVDLTQLSSEGPFRVSGKPQMPSLPIVLGLLNSDAGQISFARVDLSKCSFYGSHGLGKVEIESTVTFSQSPWWCGRRRYIVDEYAWRANAGILHSYGWRSDGVHVGTEPPKRQRGEVQRILLRPLAATQVAAIYRDLRCSLESRSDMSGAADFYYGEMEMRRWSAPPFERVLLWLYYLTSGYGMRLGRAFFSWIAVIALGAYLMKFGGFSINPYSASRAMLFATRATLPGARTIEHLTLIGEAIELGLRILGPLTIALFLIAVRNRLMRKPSDS